MSLSSMACLTLCVLALSRAGIAAEPASLNWNCDAPGAARAPEAQGVKVGSAAAQITAATQCLRDGDLACAGRQLDAADIATASVDEQGELLVLRGDLQTLQKDATRAADSYQQAVALSGLNRITRVRALTRLANDDVMNKRYPEALATFGGVMCNEWSPSMLMTAALATQGVRQFQASMDIANHAIAMQEKAGVEVPPKWRKLVEVNQARLAADPPICRLQSKLGTNRKVRVCHTAAEWEQIAKNTRGSLDEYEQTRQPGEAEYQGGGVCAPPGPC